MLGGMKLGIFLAYDRAEFSVPTDRVKAAERFGYDSVWSAEAYGSDAITPLAYLAGQTDRIRLGTGVAQLAARTPAALAMAIASLDALAGGNRAILGLGVSGPQIVEGWYGQPWGRPATRLRDYVTIVRKILRREGPVSHDGEEISLPYAGAGSIGQGKPLTSILHSNPDIPIWLGCGGPASTRLVGELCDGWLPMGLTLDNWDSHYQPILQAGADRAEPRRSLDDLEIQGGCQVVVTDDVEATLAARKPGTAFLIGGYGSETHNFHRDAMARRGYADEAAQVQALFLAGKREEAAAAVPDAYIDDSGLFGSEERIRERFERYRGGPYTGLTIHSDDIDVLEMMADIAGTQEGAR
jgi:F420-dependent oxidoreductase-like protein